MLLKSSIVLFPFIAAYFFLFYLKLERFPPVVENDDYFGPGNLHADHRDISDFEINVKDSRVQKFKDGWKGFDVTEIEGSKFQLGMNAEYFKSLNKSVQKFDWKQHQHFLNTFKQYRYVS